MPSLIPGYNYDIFVSYRHKDNKYDGWVSEFVVNLKKELEATLKEDVSIYFDENPHDGLRETHHVTDSLAPKLKCLIFIPIISQTYCDPNSFAWTQEFIAFTEIAAEDRYGLQVRLKNGNVAGRVLPVRIHDLEKEDLALLETKLKGKLRAVDFIFNAAGVNRPLKSDDQRAENTNHTLYRDQINKTALAVKEIISGLRQPGNVAEGNEAKLFSSTVAAEPVASGDTFYAKLLKRNVSRASTKYFIFIFLSVAMLVTIVLAQFSFTSDSGDSSTASNSIAVLYFDNISSDPEQEYFSDGITDEVIARLSQINGLRVTSRTSVIGYKGKLKDFKIRDIAKELNVKAVLEGSVRKSADKVRITVKLIDAVADKLIWSEIYDRDLSDIFTIQSDIAHSIAAKFKVKLPEDNLKLNAIPTANMRAYDLYLKARSTTVVLGYGAGQYTGPIEKGVSLLKEAIRLDPEYSQAYALLSRFYLDWSYHPGKMSLYDSANLLAKEAIILNPALPDGYFALANAPNEKSSRNKRLEERKRWLRKAYALDPVQGLIGFADLYFTVGDFAKAVRYYTRVSEINPNLIDPYLSKAIVYSLLPREDSLYHYLAIAGKVGPNAKEIYLAQYLYEMFSGRIEATRELARKYYGDDTLSYNKEVAIACIYAKDWEQAEKYYQRTTYRDMDVGLVLLRTGRKDSAQSYLRNSLAWQLKLGARGAPVDISRLNAVLGNHKKAIEAFREAVDRGFMDLPMIRNDPYWDDIRHHPEFIALVAGLEKKALDILRQLKEDVNKEFIMDL